MYRQYGYAVSPRLERMIDLHCNAHLEIALFVVPLLGTSSSVFSSVLIDEVLCILDRLVLIKPLCNVKSIFCQILLEGDGMRITS